jgi:hypothetical protein
MLKPKGVFDVTDHKLEKLLTRGDEQYISRNASYILQLQPNATTLQEVFKLVIYMGYNLT